MGGARAVLGVKIWGPWSRTGLGVAMAAFALDQANKYWMLHVFDIAAKGKVTLTPFFDLVMVWNRGISYGLFQQEGAAGRWMLVALTLVAVAALIVWLAAVRAGLAALALGLVIGGALGNLIDRLAYGAVADFFLFHVYGYSWYVFNIADAAIVAGVIGLMYDSLFRGHKGASNGG